MSFRTSAPYGVPFTSGLIFNVGAIGELADLLILRMLVIRKPGVTTHLTWPNCILIYVNKLVNMQITAGRRFFANSRSSTNSPTATRLRNAGWLVDTPRTVYE